MDAGHYNRLVIVGNGFDLNLGLKTSYNDFMVWLIKEALKDAMNGNSNPILRIPNPKRIRMTAEHIGEIESKNTLVDLKSCAKEIGGLHFNHTFIKRLYDKASQENWVDIEYEFFLHLKGLVEKKERVIYPKFEEDIRKLNDCLDNLTTKLHGYVHLVDKGIHIEQNDASYYADLFGKKKPMEVHGQVQIGELASVKILSFNYTNSLSTITQLLDDQRWIPIHGWVKGSSEIIFGYGDDTDKFFRRLEAQNMNDLLRHNKSFYYGLTSNYSELLTFLDANPLEVLIVGHSCGISDRTLLKTIFEHPNCRAIRILHRGSKQDYVEKYINISRHFTDKVRMRQVVQPYDENFVFLKN